MFLEKAFTIFVLCFSTGAFFPLFRQESIFELDRIEGNPWMQGFWLGVYIIILILICIGWKRAVYVGMRSKLLVLLVVIATLSVFWSDVPFFTVRRVGALVGTTMFGMYLATRYSVREQLQLIVWALGFCAAASLLLALIIPSIGVSSGTHEGAWKGVYIHKNALGKAMSLSIIVSFIVFYWRDSSYRLMTLAIFTISTWLLFLSNSMTALILLISILLMIPFYRSLRFRGGWLLICLLLITSVSSSLMVWILQNTSEVLSVLGRDVTLTGRTNLWPIVFEMIRERPWLGYGYNAFWLGLQGESRYVWLTSFEAVNGHNGYMDLALDLGFLGLGVFIVGYFINFMRALILARGTKAIEGLWPVIYLTFMILYNITESSILVRNDIFWILYVATVLSIPPGQAKEASG